MASPWPGLAPGGIGPRAVRKPVRRPDASALLPLALWGELREARRGRKATEYHKKWGFEHDRAKHPIHSSSLGVDQESARRPQGASGRLQEASRKPQELPEEPGRLQKAFWELLKHPKPSWRLLGPSWSLLGPPWGLLGPPWASWIFLGFLGFSRCPYTLQWIRLAS